MPFVIAVLCTLIKCSFSKICSDGSAASAVNESWFVEVLKSTAFCFSGSVGRRVDGVMSTIRLTIRTAADGL